jgi:hypothetical protein
VSTESIALRLTSFMLSVSAACADDSATDAGVVPDAMGAELAIGTGGVTCYLPLDDGDTVYLARGCQGGQHLWLSLRARGLDLMAPLVMARAFRTSDETDVGPVAQVRLTFDPLPGEDWFALNGLRILVPEPDDVDGEEIVVRVRLRENRSPGLTIERDKRLRVEWGPEDCGGPTLCELAGGLDGSVGGLDAGALDRSDAARGADAAADAR